MIWVTWQQHRSMLLVGAALLLAMAAVLVASGITIHQTFTATALPACLAQGGLDQGCLALRHDFAHRFGDVAGIVQVFVTIFPLIGGTFLGATLLGREYEMRTHLLAWTQSATRLRWTAVKLLVLGGATVAPWAGLTLLMMWWRQPLDAVHGSSFDAFEVEGPVPVAYGLFGLALGAAAGAAIRRMVPAMAATLGLFVGAKYVVATFLRPYYLRPLVETWDPTQDPPRADRGDYFFGLHALDPHGGFVSQAQLDGLYQQFRLAGGKEGIFEFLRVRGIRFSDYYHPGDRFWTFQAIETAIFAVLAAVLLTFTLWWVRARTA